MTTVSGRIGSVAAAPADLLVVLGAVRAASTGIDSTSDRLRVHSTRPGPWNIDPCLEFPPTCRPTADGTS